MSTAPGGVGADDPGAAAPDRARNRLAVTAQRARSFVKSHRVLMAPAEWLERSIDKLPGPLHRAAARLRDSVVRQTPLEDLLTVIDCLESQGIGYWLAGGWGVDALMGRQTRRHRDIDIVIDDFECNEPKVRRAMPALGFHHVNMDTGGVWMPRRSNFEDGAGHRVEFLNIDWDHLRAVFALDPQRDPATAWSSDDLAAEMLTTGSIDGRAVRCLTAAAQLLFHSGFYLEPSGHANMALLRSERPRVYSLEFPDDVPPDLSPR